MPRSNQNPNASTAISKYQKTNKLVEIVRKCKLLDINNQAIINTIEFETGRIVTKSELDNLIEAAAREVREQQIEVDKHMEYMVKLGLYTDTMNNHYMLSTVEKIIYTMIMEEQAKPPDDKSTNKILAMSNTLKNIIQAKDGLVTNIGFLAKIKNVYENTTTTNNNNENNNEEPVIELNKKVNVMIKDQKTDINKLIDETIDKKELENNRVA